MTVFSRVAQNFAPQRSASFHAHKMQNRFFSQQAKLENMTNIIIATTPVVAPLVQPIVHRFYDTLFERHPSVKSIFNKTNQVTDDQRNSLAAAVTAAVVNIKDLSVIMPRINEIVHKHCALVVLPAHYGAVHECLMDSIAHTVPAEYLTDEVVTAWSDFINLLAKTFIDLEEAEYQKADARGWRGFKALKLIEKKDVGTDVKTFTFETEKPVPFEAGHYMTVKAPTEGSAWAPEARRHYTVTGIIGEPVLQISTKHIPGGQVSGYMHEKLNVGDTMEATIPFGAVTVNKDKPYIIMSAGIGITQSLAAYQMLPKDKILSVVHVDKNEAARPLKERLLMNRPQDICMYTDETGRVGPNVLLDQILAKVGEKALDDATFQMCGPTMWMIELEDELKKRGAKSIEASLFGPRKR